MTITRIMNNQPVTASVGGAEYHFRSRLEWRWAQYLQLLKEQGQIKGWTYETQTFYFPGVERGPFIYRPDFLIVENDGGFLIQECKGYHDAQTNSKFRRMVEGFPDIRLELVLQSVPKRNQSKGANRRRVALKYVRRIIDAREIFKQVRGMIQWEP